MAEQREHLDVRSQREREGGREQLGVRDREKGGALWYGRTWAHNLTRFVGLITSRGCD